MINWKVESRRFILAGVGALVVNVVFFPWKGDHFSLVEPLVIYFILLVLLALVLPLKVNWFEKVVVRIPSVLLLATIILALNYFYIGRSRLLCNAAAYDHPVILDYLIDKEDHEELARVKSCAELH